MCPSYRVTHEEEHSTRGRAHLLWEMTQACEAIFATVGAAKRSSIRSIFASRARDARATVRSASTSQPIRPNFFRTTTRDAGGRECLRLRQHRFLGAAGFQPSGTRKSDHPAPFLRDLAKVVAGIPPQRSIPAFAPEHFHNPWAITVRRSRLVNVEWSTPVLLWADTFNNYFLPATAKAAVDVLETAGFRVLVPQANLCCGRPLYDFGMLDRAETLLLKSSTNYRLRLKQEFLSSVLNPVALPSFATN